MVSIRAATKHGLRQNYLSFPEVIAQSVGGVAPSVTPGLLVPILFGMAGNASWVSLGFAGVALFFVTLQINVFASRIASPGALYVYVGEGLGPFAGIVAGWSLMIAYFFCAAVGTTEIALTALAFFNQLAGTVTTIGLATLLSIFGLGAVWWFAHRDIKLSTRVSLSVEVTVAVLILALITAWFLHKGSIIDPPQLDFKGMSFGQFHLGLVFAFFTFVGFESASVLGAEARKPLILIPRAMLVCVVIVTIFFIVSSYGMVSALRDIAPGIDKETAPLVSLSHLVGVNWLGIILTAGLCSSFFAATLAMVNGGARVLYTLAHHGLFHSLARKVHNKNATPHAAIACVSILALVMSLSLTLSGVALMDAVNYLGTLSTFGFLFAYLMIAVAAPFYLKQRRELNFWHIISSIISMVLIGVALEGSVYPVTDWPSNLLPYIFLVLLGLGVCHFLYLRRTNPKELKAMEKELLGD
jgi:amino acid transporter